MDYLVIHCISDTHNKHKQLTLPGGDILIHAGDMSGRGHSGEILPFLDWFADQDYKYLILVPGNHDKGFEQEPARYKEECEQRGIILLNDSGIEIEGIKIWGSPITPWFHNWAFNRWPEEILKHWDMIPEDTDILITHGPPRGILDYIPNQNLSVGCPHLLHKILKTKIKLHVFGHIHEGRGYTYEHGKMFINASTLDGTYKFMPGNPYKVVRDVDGEFYAEDTIKIDK